MNPCPNAKRSKGRLRFVGEPEFVCTVSCTVCHGKGFVINCDKCSGCGIVNGAVCSPCRGRGLLPYVKEYPQPQ